MELNLLILCLQRFILSSSIQFCLNTYLCSLAQFFHKLTELKRHVPENSQRPSVSPLPGNTCSGHYKGAQLSQAPLQSWLESMHSLFLILNVGSDSKFPPKDFFSWKKWVNLRYLLDTLHGKEYLYFFRLQTDLLMEKHPTFQSLEVSVVWGRGWDSCLSTPCGTKALEKISCLIIQSPQSKQL